MDEVFFGKYKIIEIKNQIKYFERKQKEKYTEWYELNLI